jgi:MFS family permease
MLVLSWLVLQTTDSPFQLGLLLVFNNAPRPLFSLFAGLVADRFSRRRILFAAQTTNTLLAGMILAFIWFEHLATWHVFLAVFLQGIAKSLEDPSRRTAILDIVGEGRLVNALSLDTISNTVGKMIGPLLGGALIDGVGFSGAYLVTIVIHLMALAVLTRVRIPPSRQYGGQTEAVWRSLGTSLRHAMHSPMLLGMLYVTIVMNALAFPVQQFIPAVGRDNLGVGATLVGLLVAAEGIGQLAGAGLMALSRDLRRHGRVFTLGSLAVLIMVILFVWSPWYALAFGLLIAGGIGQAGFGTMQSAITMLEAPRDMRGRMMGLLSVCIGVGTPLGTLEIGAMATLFSTQWALSVNAFAGFILLIPAIFFTPLVWRPSTGTVPEPAA